MSNRLAQLKFGLANMLADMMIHFRKNADLSDDALWDAAYKHIAGKLDVLIDAAYEEGREDGKRPVVPVTDLVPLELQVPPRGVAN